MDPSQPRFAHVASWAQKYLDSGVAMSMDVEDSGSDYDSDESRDSIETVHHSYSYVPSELEVRQIVIHQRLLYVEAVEGLMC